MSKSFESSRAPEPVGAFPHAKRVGNLLFLSGIGPRKRGRRAETHAIRKPDFIALSRDANFWIARDPTGTAQALLTTRLEAQS